MPSWTSDARALPRLAARSHEVSHEDGRGVLRYNSVFVALPCSVSLFVFCLLSLSVLMLSFHGFPSSRAPCAESGCIAPSRFCVFVPFVVLAHPCSSSFPTRIDQTAITGSTAILKLSQVARSRLFCCGECFFLPTSALDCYVHHNRPLSFFVFLDEQVPCTLPLVFFLFCVSFILAFQFLALPSHALTPSIPFEFWCNLF